jgi:hypothetical protein
VIEHIYSAFLLSHAGLSSFLDALAFAILIALVIFAGPATSRRSSTQEYVRPEEGPLE